MGWSFEVHNRNKASMSGAITRHSSTSPTKPSAHERGGWERPAGELTIRKPRKEVSHVLFIDSIADLVHDACETFACCVVGAKALCAVAAFVGVTIWKSNKRSWNRSRRRGSSSCRGIFSDVRDTVSSQVAALGGLKCVQGTRLFRTEQTLKHTDAVILCSSIVIAGRICFPDSMNRQACFRFFHVSFASWSGRSKLFRKYQLTKAPLTCMQFYVTVQKFYVTVKNIHQSHPSGKTFTFSFYLPATSTYLD